MYGFYLLRHVNGQMHVCLIASHVKIITKRVAVVYRFKSVRMVSIMLRLICVFLDRDIPIQLGFFFNGITSNNTAGAIKRVRRLEDRFIMY